MAKNRETRPGTRSYKDVKEPNLKIRDVLIGLYDRWGGEVKELKARDVADEFGVSIHDSCNRLSRLRRFGCIRMSKKSRPHAYIITAWGIECAIRWKKVSEKKCDINSEVEVSEHFSQANNFIVFYEESSTKNVEY